MSLPDWKLPKGVNRSLWEYTQQPHIARDYDQSIATSGLARYDACWLREQWTKPGRLIDLGCGTGRLAVDFAQRGFEVLGVDLSQEMLLQLREKAREHHVSVGVLRANLCDLSGLCDRCWDYALLMYATLGMIPGESARRWVLEHVFRLLKPGGRFALHIHNRWFNVWDPQGRAWLLKNLWESWRRGTPLGDRIVHDRGIPNFHMHVFSRGEILGLLRQVGFQIEACHPLNAVASGPLSSSWLSSMRANGWIILTRKPG